MPEISSFTMLLRGPIKLPDGLKIDTEIFQDDWSFVRSGDSHWLDKTIRSYGWHFVWIGEGLLKHGVGKTSEKAIVSALNIVLRHVNKDLNAAEIEFVEIKKYPWFFLAGVKVYPYQIQHGSVLSSSVESLPPVHGISIQGLNTNRPQTL